MHSLASVTSLARLRREKGELTRHLHIKSFRPSTVFSTDKRSPWRSSSAAAGPTAGSKK
jgi:hypothetical protein